MEKKKKSTGKKQYLNDFQPALNGEYIYTGNFYSPQMEPVRYDRLRIMTGLLLASSVLCVLAAGLLPAAGSLNSFYVILPFLAVIICCFVKTGKTGRLLLSGFTVREYVYLKTVPAMPGWTIAEAASAAGTLIGETVFLLIHGFGGRLPYTIAFICFLALDIILNGIMFRLIRQIKWEQGMHEQIPKAD